MATLLNDRGDNFEQREKPENPFDFYADFKSDQGAFNFYDVREKKQIGAVKSFKAFLCLDEVFRIEHYSPNGERRTIFSNYFYKGDPVKIVEKNNTGWSTVFNGLAKENDFKAFKKLNDLKTFLYVPAIGYGDKSISGKLFLLKLSGLSIQAWIEMSNEISLQERPAIKFSIVDKVVKVGKKEQTFKVPVFTAHEATPETLSDFSGQMKSSLIDWLDYHIPSRRSEKEVASKAEKTTPDPENVSAANDDDDLPF